ncbi:MAG TPA: ATP synthase F1 subunit gamma [Armatimonadota bacterium]|jgi:F-type H+-transporting ATPase subunit gamma
MASARDIRRRIRTVKNIQQITGAMKMVAAARLRRAQEAVESARPYAEQMRYTMERLAESAGELQHPLLEHREGGRLGLLVFTSDRGLCGSYNVNVLRKATEVLRGSPADSVRLYLVGTRGRDFLRRRGYPIAYSQSAPGGVVRFADVRRLTGMLRQDFERGEVDQVQLVFAQFVSAISQKPSVKQVLPLEAPSQDGYHAGSVGPLHADYIYEPSPEELLGGLLPRYVDTQIYQALLESVASEHGARMTSMSNATSNAGEMIDTLTLDLNRARQAGITKELAEIIGGVEAQKG